MNVFGWLTATPPTYSFCHLAALAVYAGATWQALTSAWALRRFRGSELSVVTLTLGAVALSVRFWSHPPDAMATGVAIGLILIALAATRAAHRRPTDGERQKAKHA